jgi:hypothetical protein
MKLMLSLSISIFFILCVHTIHASQDNSLNALLGYWKIMDEMSDKPKAIVRIEEAHNHLFLARIIKIYSVPSINVKKNKLLPGMIILQHLTKSKIHQYSWTGGQLYNPNNGKNYLCHIQMRKNGKELIVTNYVNLPLFGRSQTWVKEDILSRVLAT